MEVEFPAIQDLAQAELLSLEVGIAFTELAPVHPQQPGPVVHLDGRTGVDTQSNRVLHPIPPTQ
jgi:hypothetical protein